MKTTIIRTAVATLILLLGVTFSSHAQTYYHLYLCDNATATLHPQEPVTPLVANDKVHWFLDGAPLTVKTYDGTNASIDITVPDNLAVGPHKYKTAIESKDGCLGPESDEFTVYKLPTKTLALTQNRASYCAEESNTIKNATITATTTINPNILPLPDGIEYAYTWSVTKDGTPAQLSDIGTADGSKTATSEFDMTVKDKGVYVFSTKVKYVLTTAAVASAFQSVLKANDGCEVSQTATSQITVTPKPGKPTITLAN